MQNGAPNARPTPKTGGKIGPRVGAVFQSPDFLMAANSFAAHDRRGAANGVALGPDNGLCAGMRASDTQARDPVCGMTVDNAAARANGLSVHHRGREYIFCSAGCADKFRAMPEHYEAALSARPGNSALPYVCPMHPEVRNRARRLSDLRHGAGAARSGRRHDDGEYRDMLRRF